MGHNSYISNHPGFLLLPIPTGNEKYEIFLNQARENLENELDKDETLSHAETIEEMSEDEPFKVRLAPLCTECMWRKDSMCKGPGAGRTWEGGKGIAKTG